MKTELKKWISIKVDDHNDNGDDDDGDDGDDDGHRKLFCGVKKIKKQFLSSIQFCGGVGSNVDRMIM